MELRPHTFVDFRDTNDRWQTAYILELTEKEAYIQLEGQDRALWLPVKSPRLAPFRRFSVASTASSFTALWSMKLGSLQEFSGKFTYIQSLSAPALTQFLRGELVYRLVAVVRQGAECQVSEAQFLYRGVLAPAMNLMLDWLDSLKSLTAGYYTAQTSPESYLTDATVALAVAFPELSLCLRILLGEEQSTAHALQRFDEVHHSPSFTLWSRSSLNCVSEMLRNYSPSALNSLLQDLTLPLEILAHIPIGPLCKYLYLTNYADLPHVFELVLARISTLSERDIKDYDQGVKKAVINHLSDLQKIMRLEDCKLLKRIDLDLSLKLLKSSFLEKRIRGLNEIKESIEESSKSKSYFWTFRASSELTDIVDWLSQNHVLDIICDSSHAELIKRSYELYELMGGKKRLSQEQLTALWRSIEFKHESYVIAVYDLLARMPCWMNTLETRFLYDLVTKSKPEIDEKYLKFIKDFSVNALNAKNKDNFDYGAELFFALVIKEQHEYALKSLLALLIDCQIASKRQIYIEKGLKCFIEDISVPQCLQLVLNLLEKSSFYEQMDMLSVYHRRMNLTTALTSSINGYVEITRDRHITEDTLTSDKTLHSKHLRVRFTLLALLICRGIRMEMPHFEVLWRAVVTNPILESDSKCMFDWILCVTEGNRGLNLEECRLILEYFGDSRKFDVSKASKESFQAFSHLFITVNRGKSLEIRGNTILKRLDVTVTGLDTVLSFALNSASEEVSGSAMFLVLECSVLLSSRVPKNTIWLQLLSHLQKVLSEEYTDRTNKALKLCHCLIDLNVPGVWADSKAGKMVLQLTLPGTRSERITVPSDLTLGQLRRKIAEMVHTHPTKIRLRWARMYGEDEDEQPLYKVLGYNTSLAVEIQYSLVDDVRPQELLASDGLYENLFRLAAHPDSAHFAWELLLKLPHNRTLKQSLEKMETSVLQPPTPQTFYKCFYSLIVVSEFCQSPEYADQFLSNAVSQSMLKSVFEMDVSTLGCSGLMLVKFIEVVITHIRKLLRRYLTLFEPAKVLTQGLNLLHSVSINLEKGCEKAVDEIKGLLTDSYREGQSSLYESVIATHPMVKETLLAAILQCQVTDIRLATSNLVLHLSRPPFNLASVFLKILLELLLIAVQEKFAFYYFLTVSKLVKIAGGEYREMLLESSKDLLEMLPSKRESSMESRDEVLLGSLKLLHSIGKSLNFPVFSEDLVTFLQQCLLDVSPICKHQDTRKMAYKVLMGMTVRTEGGIGHLLPHFARLYEDPRWRTGRLSAWEVSPDRRDRSMTGFVGIRNPGCICYMISALQQLYMVSSFRASLLNQELPSQDCVDDNLLYVCQRIFAGLKHSTKQCISIKRLCKVLEGSSAVNVNEQMDVEEFLNAFMDHLEQKLGGNKELIASHFGGQLATEILGKGGCNHNSERFEAFFTLPLEVKNKKSLTESLESLVNGETLEGDNAYQCDECSAKVTAKRRLGLHHLPNILIIALRRFDYNLDTMRRMKLNHYYEFPWDLDLEPYTIEGLHKRDLSSPSPESTFPETYYKFSLRGVVIHTGSAEGGHYYSFIQDRSSLKWLEFNDTIVREVDPLDIPAHAFGGEEKFKTASSYGETVETHDKITNAYLLIYERKESFEPRDQNQKELKGLMLSEELPEALSTAPLITRITEKNKKNWLRKNAFEENFLHFVVCLAQEEMTNLYVFKLALSVFLTVICRTRDKNVIQVIYPELQKAVMTSEEAAQWLVEVISYPEVTQELLLVCPHSYLRKIFTLLVEAASGKLSPEVKGKALGRVVSRMEQAKQSLHYTEYFELIYLLVRELPPPVELNLVERLVAFISGRPLPYSTPSLPPDNPKETSLGYADYQPPPSHFLTFAPLKPPCVGYILATLSEFPLTSNQRFEVLYPPFFKECMYKLTGKTGGRLAGHFYASLAKEDEAATRQILSLIVGCLKEASVMLIKTALRVLAVVLKIEDRLHSDRAQIAVNELVMIMKEVSFEKEKTHIELLGLFLYKEIIRNEKVRYWVSRSSAGLNWVDDWIRRWTSSSQYVTEVLEQSVARRLRALSQCRRSVIDDEWDSDEEVELRTAGRVLVYKSFKSIWEYATVMESFGPVARVKVEDTVLWVESDSEDLRPCR